MNSYFHPFTRVSPFRWSSKMMKKAQVCRDINPSARMKRFSGATHVQNFEEDHGSSEHIDADILWNGIDKTTVSSASASKRYIELEM